MQGAVFSLHGGLATCVLTHAPLADSEAQDTDGLGPLPLCVAPSLL